MPPKKNHLPNGFHQIGEQVDGRARPVWYAECALSDGQFVADIMEMIAQLRPQ
jgi:hypothetical protein